MFQAWRSVSTDSIFRWLATSVLITLILVSITRLSILPGDVEQLPDLQGQGNAVRQAIFLICAGCMAVVIRPLANPRKLVDFPPLLWVLILWCMASIYWSIAPDVGLRRLILTILVIWLSFRTVDQLGYRRSTEILFYTALGLLAANLVAVATTPRAIHQGLDMLKDPGIVGAWRGILSDKNSAGLLTAITILMAVFGVGRMGWPLRLGVIGCATLFLIGTHSKTSLAVTGVAIIIGAAFYLYSPRYRRLLIPLLIIMIAAFLYFAVVYLPAILQQLASSRDALTGRVEIWRALGGYISDNPWLGAGFGTFWNVGAVSPIRRYTNVGWIISLESSGHSGYIDVATQLGLLGLAVAFIALFIVPLVQLLVSIGIERKAGAVQFAILIFMMIHNFTESTMLVPDQFGEVLLMISIACIRDIRRGAAGDIGRSSPSMADFRMRQRARAQSLSQAMSR